MTVGAIDDLPFKRRLTWFEGHVRDLWRKKLNTMEIAQTIQNAGHMVMTEAEVANALGRLQDYAYRGEIGPL